MTNKETSILCLTCPVCGHHCTYGEYEEFVSCDVCDYGVGTDRGGLIPAEVHVLIKRRPADLARILTAKETLMRAGKAGTYARQVRGDWILTVSGAHETVLEILTGFELAMRERKHASNVPA